MMNDWIQGNLNTVSVSLHSMWLGLLLAFVCGQTTAWVYMWTHTGVSYSRSFVNSLLVIPIIVSLVMQVLANNLITAFGLMSVFAIIRFRNILRDTLDTSYVLGVIVMGMACGTMKHSIAVTGCLLLSLVMFYLHFTEFGARQNHDLLLNLHWSRPAAEMDDLRKFLSRHSRTAICTNQHTVDTGGGIELSYHIRLRDPGRMEELLAELTHLTGVSRVHGLRADADSEM
jgi:hypothetical protein